MIKWTSKQWENEPEKWTGSTLRVYQILAKGLDRTINLSGSGSRSAIWLVLICEYCFQCFWVRNGSRTMKLMFEVAKSESWIIPDEETGDSTKTLKPQGPWNICKGGMIHIPADICNKPVSNTKIVWLWWIAVNYWDRVWITLDSLMFYFHPDKDVSLHFFS